MLLARHEKHMVYLSFRLWQRIVEIDVRTAMYEEVRLLYASAVEAWGIEKEDDAHVRMERDVALRDRDEAIRQRNFYRVHAETLERELENRRLSSTPLRDLSDHRRLSSAKWIDHLKSRRKSLSSTICSDQRRTLEDRRRSSALHNHDTPTLKRNGTLHINDDDSYNREIASISSSRRRGRHSASSSFLD